MRLLFFYENTQNNNAAFIYYKKAFKIKKDRYYLIKMIEMLHKDGDFKNIVLYFRMFKWACYKTDIDIIERMIDLYYIHPTIRHTDIFAGLYKSILFFIHRDKVLLKKDFVQKTIYLKRDIKVRGEIPYFEDFLHRNINYINNRNIIDIIEFEAEIPENCNIDLIINLIKEFLEGEVEFIVDILKRLKVKDSKIKKILLDNVCKTNKRFILDFLLHNKMFIDFILLKCRKI